MYKSETPRLKIRIQEKNEGAGLKGAGLKLENTKQEKEKKVIKGTEKVELNFHDTECVFYFLKILREGLDQIFRESEVNSQYEMTEEEDEATRAILETDYFKDGKLYKVVPGEEDVELGKVSDVVLPPSMDLEDLKEVFKR